MNHAVMDVRFPIRSIVYRSSIRFAGNRQAWLQKMHLEGTMGGTDSTDNSCTTWQQREGTDSTDYSCTSWQQREGTDSTDYSCTTWQQREGIDSTDYSCTTWQQWGEQIQQIIAAPPGNSSQL